MSKKIISTYDHIHKLSPVINEFIVKLMQKYMLVKKDEKEYYFACKKNILTGFLDLLSYVDVLSQPFFYKTNIV